MHSELAVEFGDAAAGAALEIGEAGSGLYAAFGVVRICRIRRVGSTAMIDSLDLPRRFGLA